MYPTHHKGLIGELAFTMHLLELGYTVLSPVNANSCYDLVTEKDGKYTRIQVKYLTPNNGRLRVELGRPKRKTKSYSLRGVDAMGIFDSANKKFYLIPMKLIHTKSQFWVRVSKTKNFQKKGIHFAEEFEI